MFLSPPFFDSYKSTSYDTHTIPQNEMVTVPVIQMSPLLGECFSKNILLLAFPFYQSATQLWFMEAGD